MTFKNITIELILLIIFLFLFNCKKTDPVIYKNMTFEEVYSFASINNKPYCIVLFDSTQNFSKTYFKYLKEDYKNLTEKAIYNIVDINSVGNEWYIKWLLPQSIPLTCVFAPDGTLIDLIPGISKESFLYSEEAITNMDVTDFHWPNQFKINKKRILPLFNDLLKHKKQLNDGIYISAELNQLIDSLS